MLADAACILSSWLVAVNAYRLTGLAHYHTSEYLRIWPIALLFCGINFVARLYHGKATYPSLPLSPVEEYRRLVMSAVSTHVLVIAFFGFSHRTQEISSFLLVAGASLTLLTAQLFRDAVRWILWKLKLGLIPAVMVGDGASGGQAKKVLCDTPYYGFRIVRRFHRDDCDEIVEYARDRDVKHVICAYKDSRFLAAQLEFLSTHFSYIVHIPTAKAFPVSDARAISIGSLGGLEMVNQRRMKLQVIEKWLLDKLLSVLIFTVTSPLYLIVPVLIKLTSRGPVFYRTRRLGKRGREFSLLKFRSMYIDAEQRLQSLLSSDPALRDEFARNFKLKNDPRITPIGRFLRMTSIDELPQLFNVFSGEMALVGPRPIVEKEIHYYGDSYEIFSSVKPGITGLWQVSGRSDIEYSSRVALDVSYVLNWSVWTDLWIVYRTVVEVLFMRGAR